MNKTIRENLRVARKKHECNACLWLSSCVADVVDYMTYAEKKDIVRALRRDEGYIQPGETYIDRAMIYDGTFCYTKSKIAIDNICCDHEIYCEW